MRRAAVIATAALLAAGLCAPAIACDLSDAPPHGGPATAAAGDIRQAAYGGATLRYDHGILGDAVEAASLHVATTADGACDISVTLPASAVFEDTAPRIADLDGDGRNEVIVVETLRDRGAALAVYGLRDGHLVKRAATAPIGRPHRWLAPAGIGDLDGDGRLEIAYVDRPHLAHVLRILRWSDGTLTEIAAASGLTNHRIGDTVISGGLRTCPGPELVLADAAWTRLRAVRLEAGRLVARDLGPIRGDRSFAAALACR